jgi:hypothetical protein
MSGLVLNDSVLVRLVSIFLNCEISFLRTGTSVLRCVLHAVLNPSLLLAVGRTCLHKKSSAE